MLFDLFTSVYGFVVINLAKHTMVVDYVVYHPSQYYIYIYTLPCGIDINRHPRNAVVICLWY